MRRHYYFMNGYKNYYCSGSKYSTSYFSSTLAIKMSEICSYSIASSIALGSNPAQAIKALKEAEKEIVVHRLIRIVKADNEVFYYTKGDANKEEDDYLIKKEDIIGIVRFKIPYIGYPTVWFSEI